MKLSTVLSTQPARFDAVVYKGNVQQNIDHIAGIGYDGVELAVRDPNQIDVSAIKRAVARNNLAVPAIGTGQAYGEEKLSFTDANPDIRRQAITRIKSHINLATSFDAVVILGLIRGVTPPGISKTKAQTWLIEALQECANAALQANVRLVIEPINRYETDLINNIEEGIWLLDQVGADNLGLLPDTFHMNIEEPSIVDSLRRAASMVFHFHVADSNRWYPGAGHLNFHLILSVLREDLCYKGWISAETLPHPDPNTAAERGLAHLRNCISELED